MKESLKIISRLLSDSHITTDEFIILYNSINEVEEHKSHYRYNPYNRDDSIYPITIPNTEPYIPNYPYYITCDS